MTPSLATAAVIGLEGRRAKNAPQREPKGLLEAVYSAGSLLLRADDRPARAVAAMLGRLGFLIVDEIEADGTTRRLAPTEMGRASIGHPWRVSKADLGGFGTIGAADTIG